MKGIKFRKVVSSIFRACFKVANEGSHKALNCMAFCYENGFGVEKNAKIEFELYLKSAGKGNHVALMLVFSCINGIAKDENKGFQCFMKSTLAGNINAILEL
ncbi:hypothetical protein Glove_255g8 [Diversispora epigaea]|uniref:Uncharacterized protein n=1 Tax=Diversispora epigaea TaxID=1348612 RepID=A0A397IED3_9GLOM|nr:hypothetical protein Glove_255g8 [Diversispora epigaea]